MKGCISFQNAQKVEETQPNEQIEKIKSESKMFFSFFLQQLKSPSVNFNEKDSSIKNSIFSISLYVLLTALAVYSIIRSVFGGGFEYYGPSFIQIVFYFAIFSLLVLTINLTAIFVTTKLFSENLTFKEVIRKVGSFFSVPIIFSAVGLLMALINSNALSSIVLYIGGILAFGTIPTYIMIKLLANKTKTIDGFYAFLFYIAFTAIAGFVIVLLIADSAIGELISYMRFF